MADSIMRNFITCFTTYFWGDQIKEEMGGHCSMSAKDDKLVQNVGQKI